MKLPALLSILTFLFLAGVACAKGKCGVFSTPCKLDGSTWCVKGSKSGDLVSLTLLA
jgi:hypothetical protein